MTTNHCPTCISASREHITEGMAEVLMDDDDLDYDTAVARLDPVAVKEQIIEYLDGIIADQVKNSNTTSPSTCVFVHNDWY